MKFNAAKKALLATAVSSALVASANLASAADLDQLSDEDLLARIEALEKAIKGKGNVVLNGNKKVKIVVNGQINNVVRFSDNGADSTTQVLDNDASSSRFRILGKAKLNDRFSAKTAFEFDLESNPRDELDQDDDFNLNAQVGDGANFEIRKAEAIFVDKYLGSIFLGQGDTASNKSAEVDLSGSTLAVGDASFDDDALDFVTSAGAGFNNVGDILDPVDGLSRQQRIRYETPKVLGGFKASASYVSDRTYDAAITYSNKKVGDFSVKGAAAYFAFLESDAVNPVANEQSRAFTGSISALHKPTGLNLTGGYHNFFDNALSTADEDDYVAWWVKAGWQGKVTSLGKTAIAVDYQNGSGTPETDEFAAVTTNQLDSFSVGVQATQKIDKLSTEAFVGYRLYSVDSDFTTAGAALTDDIEDIHVVAAGARVKF